MSKCRILSAICAFWALVLSGSGVMGADIWVTGVLEEASGKYSRCVAVSEDGNWVVGNSRTSGVNWPFYWSKTGGIQSMGAPVAGGGYVRGCATAYGALVACGNFPDPDLNGDPNIEPRAAKWSGGSWSYLPGQGDKARSVYGIGRNDSTGETWIVGSSYPAENEKAYRYRWSNNSYIDFWGYYQDAYSVARNGWAVGKNNWGNGQTNPDWRYDHPIFIFDWNQNCSGGGNCGWDQLNRFAGYGDTNYYKGRATAINGGATWAVGYLTYNPADLNVYHAFKWQVPSNPTPSPSPWLSWSRPVDLGVLGAGDNQSFAYCVSDSSTNPVIGGTSYGSFKYVGYKAVYWDNAGVHDLYAVLQAGGVDMSRWGSLARVYGVSADGNILVGYGYYDDDDNPATAQIEMGFVVDRSASAPQTPTITQHPGNQIACAGGSATFSVTAIGPGTLTYQWQKNLANLSNGGHYSGVTTRFLTVSSADAGDVANYRCVVSNAYGSANSNQASLSVISGAPSAPADGVATADRTDAITWKWTDVANESGYRVKDTAGTPKSGDVAANTTQWQETGLSANTQFSRRVHSFNACGESAGSPGQSRYTLAAAPTYGVGTVSPTVSCDKGSSAAYLGANAVLTFTATNGFGSGAARVGQFGYIWNQVAGAPTSWAGEQFWTTGGLTTQLGTSGSWYLHLRSYNNDSPKAVNATVLNLGPYSVGGAFASCLQNAGFENGFTGGVGNNWIKFQYSGSVTCGDETTQVHSGGHAQRIVSSSSSSEGGVYQQFDAVVGNSYTVRAWFKCSNSSTMTAYLGVDPLGRTNAGLSGIAWDSTNSTNWTQQTWTGLAQASKITVFVDAAGAGTVYVDDVEPSCSTFPPTPADGTPQALTPTAIRWAWGDVTGETGYRVKDTGGISLSGDLPANTTHWDQTTGIQPNTQHTRTIVAFNGAGESAPSTGQTCWSLSVAPGAGSVTPSRTAGCADVSIVWTAAAGFGTGSAEYYRYAWDQSVTHTWTGMEPQWSSGTLSLTPTATGTWYLHLRGYNGAGVANGTYSYSIAVGPPAQADFDHDCDVDAADLDMFVECITGPGLPYTAQGLPPDCHVPLVGEDRIAADFDLDGDVDQADFGVFQRCFSGSDQSAAAGCAN